MTAVQYFTHQTHRLFLFLGTAMVSDKVGAKEDGDGNISLSCQSSSTDDYEKAVAKIRSLLQLCMKAKF